jgi:glycosyltransferase involved in cell wall biosynthesis
MRILHVVPTYYPAVRYGGPIRSVHGLASALAAQGHDVHVYTTNVDGAEMLQVPRGRPVHVDGVNVWYFETGIGRRIYRSPKMRRVLATEVGGFDIVHLHTVFLWPTWAAAQSARRVGVPYVLSPRGMLVKDLIKQKSSLAKRAWISLFEHRNIEAAAVIHLTSETEASELRMFGFRSARLAIVANGVEFPRKLPLRKAAIEFGTHRPFVLFLGRINWKKGLDRLIPAMRQVLNADLLIAGNDEENYRSDLEALATRCGVAERVRFVGPVEGDRKWDLLSSARILALPSYSENFGNVVLEAMAVGCPVVITPEVGLANAVKEADCGVVSPGDPDRFGLEIKRLLADPERCGRMGRAGRHVVETKYTWSVIAPQMLSLYHQISSNSRSEPFASD